MTGPYTELLPNRGTCIDHGLRKCNAVILKVHSVGLRDVDLLSDWFSGLRGLQVKMRKYNV